MREVAAGLIPAGAFATGVSDDETEEEVLGADIVMIKAIGLLSG